LQPKIAQFRKTLRKQRLSQSQIILNWN